MVPNLQLELPDVFLVNLGFKIGLFILFPPCCIQSSSEVEQGSLKDIRDKHTFKEVF